MTDFNGAKLAILVDNHIVTILRDDTPGIPWPGHWDLPGGGREGGEAPENCVLREVKEELGLELRSDSLTYGVESISPAGKVWFFVTEQGDFDPNRVTFGNEGQRWDLVEIPWYLRHPKAIPHHVRNLLIYLENRPDHRVSPG